MSIIRIERHEAPYTCLSNGLLQDSRLTFAARGLAGYLLSLPFTWTISVKALAKQSPKGADHVYGLLKELRSFGYVRLDYPRDEHGRVQGKEWVITEYPQANAKSTEAPIPEKTRYRENTDTGFFSKSEKADIGENGTLIKEDFLVESNSSILKREGEATALSPVTESQFSGETALPTTEPVLTPIPEPALTPPAESPAPVTKPPRKTATRLPEDWTLPQDWRDWAAEQRPDLDLDEVAAIFKDHWLAKPGQDARKLDWQATWRNWVRREQHRGPRRQGQVHSLNRPPARLAQDDFAHKDYLGAATPDEQLPVWMREALHG